MGKEMLVPVLDSYLGRGPAYPPAYSYMGVNPVKGRTMENTLVISFRDNFFNDGSLPNKCIRTLLGNPAQMPHYWHGPVVVFKYQG